MLSCVAFYYISIFALRKESLFFFLYYRLSISFFPRTQEMEEPVFLSTSCVLQSDMPPWVVYQEVEETHKMIMRSEYVFLCVGSP